MFFIAANLYVTILGAFSSAIIAFIVLFSGLFISYIQLRMIQNTRDLAEYKSNMRLLEMKNEFMLENYQTLENHFAKIAQMKHEMNHHLFAIRTLFESNESEQLANYLSDIQGSFSEIKEPVACGNRVMQAVLGYAARLARQMDFEVVFDISPLPELSFADADMVSLFMNLLDNALESCAKIQEPCKRWIKIQVKTRKPYLYFSVQNARQGAVIMDGGRYVSAKNDPIAHGHGMDVIQKIADKYGGFVSFEHTEDTFSAEVALSVV